MLPIALLLAALLAVPGPAHADPPAAAAPDLDSQVQELRVLVREKRYPLALEGLRLLARQIQDLRLDLVRSAFPEPPSGWTATEPMSLLADEEVWGTRIDARRTYLRAGAVKIDVTFDVHSPFAPTAALSFNALFVAGDPQATLVDVGRERGRLRFNRDTGEGELRVLPARDLLVTIAGRGISSGEELVDFARRVDYALLRSTPGL